MSVKTKVTVPREDRASAESWAALVPVASAQADSTGAVGRLRCDRHHASRAYSSPWTTNSFGNFVTGADGFNSMGTQPSSAPPAERSTWRRPRSTAFGRSWRSQPVVTRPSPDGTGKEPAAVRRRRRGGGRGGRGTPHRTPGAAARDGNRSRRRAPGKQVDVGAARLGATAVAERRPPRRRPRRANGAAPRLPELATRVPAARAGQRRLRAWLTAARNVPLPGRGTLIAVGLAAVIAVAGALALRIARPTSTRKALPRTRRSAGTVGARCRSRSASEETLREARWALDDENVTTRVVRENGVARFTPARCRTESTS